MVQLIAGDGSVVKEGSLLALEDTRPGDFIGLDMTSNHQITGRLMRYEGVTYDLCINISDVDPAVSVHRTFTFKHCDKIDLVEGQQYEAPLPQLVGNYRLRIWKGPTPVKPLSQ